MPIPTYEERVGTLLGGKYRVGKVVGRGGMGAVFEGVHEGTGRPVAVKVLHREHVENPDAAERFLREARVVAGLKHPNVVDVLDLGEEPDRTVYMVLELLEGEMFARTLHREKTLTYARAAEVLVPVMRAVAYAHTRSVVHRDIKPENIFLHRDAEGRLVPKILDFGIAKALDDERDKHRTQAGFVMGTPAYMSPEQGAGIPELIGPPADVWSMGVVWYEALTGEMPFEGPTHTAVLLAVSSGKFTRLVKRLESLSVPVANAIDKAMVRDPMRRYADMGAFLDALQRAAEVSDDAARASAPAYSRASIDRVSPMPGGPETLAAPLEALRDDVVELGPVVRARTSDAVTLGDETNEPVVLLSKPRRKRRPHPVVAIAAVLALAGLGLTAAMLSRRSVTPAVTVRPAPPAVAPAVPVEAPTPALDASAAPVEVAPTPPEPAERAPTTRRGRHGSRGARDDAPAEPPPPPPAQPSAAQAPLPPVQAPTEAAPAHHGRREPAPVPNENAPITDYDHAP